MVFKKKELKKNADINIKILKYHGVSSVNILDHIKPSLKKEPDQILIHAETNDQTNDHNFLNNVKKMVKWSGRHIKTPNLFLLIDLLNRYERCRRKGNKNIHTSRKLL